MSLHQLFNAENPGTLLRVWYASGVLSEKFPLIHSHYGVPQPAEHHPEICTGWHLELCLNAAAAKKASARALFGVLLHDVGKPLTDPQFWPKHHMHEELGEAYLVQRPVSEWGEGFVEANLSEDYFEMARQVAKYHLRVHTVFQLKSVTVAKFICELRSRAAPYIHSDQDWIQWMDDFLMSCEADSSGRLGKADTPYPSRAYLMACATSPETIRLWDVLREQPSCPGDELTQWQALHTTRSKEMARVKTLFTKE